MSAARRPEPPRIGIRAVEYYLPPQTLGIEELRQRGQVTSDTKTLEAFGFQRVHVSLGESTYEMALRAARRLMERGLVDPEEIDVLVCCHALAEGHLVAGDEGAAVRNERFKYSGARLQYDLGLARASVVALAQLTCATFLSALRIVDGLCAADPTVQNALIVCADRFPADACREVAFAAIMSDASCAALVSRGWPENRALGFASLTRGYLWDWDRRQEETAGAFHGAVRETAARVLEPYGIALESVPLFVPVNVNALGWVFFANLMQIPAERMFVENVPRFGHAMSCDSAINLADVLEQRRLAPGDRFVMLSVGLGGHWCSALMER